MADHRPSSGVAPTTLIVLMLAVATISIGYGIVLPLLPALMGTLLDPARGQMLVSWNTGLLTSIYVLALFLFAPIWGKLSDRFGRRVILILGMLGFAASMLVFSFVGSLFAVYAERFLSGMFAAAVTPVAAAVIGDLATSDESRARRLTLVSVAGITGFLIGPMLGLLLTRLGTDLLPSLARSGPLMIPLAATALLALPLSLAIWITVPHDQNGSRAQDIPRVGENNDAYLVFRLLVLAFIVSGGVGAFEVGLALRGKQELGLTQGQIALMFTECSLVMIVVQAIVFSPLVKPVSTRWLITPALIVMAVGLFMVPRAPSFSLMLIVIGTVAASAGVILPILTYWISSKAGKAQGAQLGKQTSAASLGSALGSAVGGFLFDAPFHGASFILMTVVTGAGVAISLGLPRRLGVGDSREDAPGPSQRLRSATVVGNIKELM